MTWNDFRVTKMTYNDFKLTEMTLLKMTWMTKRSKLICFDEIDLFWSIEHIFWSKMTWKWLDMTKNDFQGTEMIPKWLEWPKDYLDS